MSQEVELESETQESTIDYYHERKKLLMEQILERNIPVKIQKEDELFCQVCKAEQDEVKELHIEHPNGDGEQNDGGGWQKLYKHERHFQERRDLWVVCEECHYLVHKRRGDGHADLLKRRMPFLEEYDDKDAEFLIRQRMKEGSIYE